MERWNFQKCRSEPIVVDAFVEAALVSEQQVVENGRPSDFSDRPRRRLSDEEVVTLQESKELRNILCGCNLVESGRGTARFIDVT